MFEAAELGKKVSKEEYAEAVPVLRTEPLRVQNELRLDPAFSVLIVIGGVDGAGKGQTINRLYEWMDPRYLKARAFGPPNAEEAARPPMWRFWRQLPPAGRIGIFFGSWYTAPILSRVYGETGDRELEGELPHINAFERELVDSGVLVLKFWFHIARKLHRKRIKGLLKDSEQRWRVSEQDRKHLDLYDDFLPVCEHVLRETSTGEAPWTLVEAADRRYRELAVGRHILESIERRMQAAPAPEAPAALPAHSRELAADRATILHHLDLSQKLEPKDYAEKRQRHQAALNRMSREAGPAGVSAVFVFEGWDAAGKGGVIRRITAALDARFYEVVPIAAPSDEERAHPYMWRFWRQLPAAGRLVVFDRSWYGRVLVERVEGFASPEEWRRAYKEINEFEGLLVDHGIALAKFWLHIDREEQGRRFAEREQTPYKKYKITDEDYRNREKWELYEGAVNEMVERTSTAAAPWTLVEANDKRHARVKVLETCCDTLEAALKRARKKRRRARS